MCDYTLLMRYASVESKDVGVVFDEFNRVDE